jgi:AhpD family alkylhydroperoxidase
MTKNQPPKTRTGCSAKTPASEAQPGPASSIYSPAVDELVAIGAAIACNCERCFKYHFARAKELGVSRQDMARAVTMAQKVKTSPANAILELARRHLQGADIPGMSTTAADPCSRRELDEPDESPTGCCARGD